MKRSSPFPDDHPSKQQGGTSSLAEKVSVFKSWLSENGAKHSKADILRVSSADGSEMLGLSSTESIDPNSVVLEIPEKLLISTDIIESSELTKLVRPFFALLTIKFEAIPSEVCELTDGVKVVLFLLSEKYKGHDSFWYPYIDLLPPVFSPISFNEDQLEELRGGPFIYYVEATRSELQETFEKLFPWIEKNFPASLHNTSPITWEDFLWAYLAIYSRAFHITKDGKEVTAMVPLADITNHHYNAELTSKIFDSESRTFRVSSTKPCAAQKEIYLLYAPLDNSELFLFFGFTLPDNPYDCVKIELDMLDDEEYNTSLKKMLFFGTAEGVSLSHDLKFEGDGTVINKTLMGSLRLLLMSSEEIEGYTLENIDRIFEGVISSENEEKAINTLTGVLRFMLDQYPTTLEQDTADLSNGNNMPDWKVFCYHHRMTQKKILETAIKELTEKLSKL